MPNIGASEITVACRSSRFSPLASGRVNWVLNSRAASSAIPPLERDG